MGINERLKQLRTNRGLNQTEMANILDVSLSSYQKYEREKGSVTPSLEVLIRIADFYGVTTDYLLGRDTGNTPLDELAGQFNMNLLEKKIVENYLKLPENMRGDLMEFLAKSVKEVQEESGTAPPADVDNGGGDDEGIVVAVAARSFGKNNNPAKLRLKKRPGAGSIMDEPDYKE